MNKSETKLKKNNVVETKLLIAGTYIQANVDKLHHPELEPKAHQEGIQKRNEPSDSKAEETKREIENTQNEKKNFEICALSNPRQDLPWTRSRLQLDLPSHLEIRPKFEPAAPNLATD
jgi:hypothetical protein